MEKSFDEKNSMSADRACALILGAGLMQRPAILASKELGFYTVVVDANPAAESIPYADFFEQIDLKDRDGILRFAEDLQRKGNLKAVFTAGTDFSASVSYVCERLSLPAHSFEAALNASIKPRMRECFKKAGVPSPEFFSLSKDEISEEKVRFITEALGFPCVVKPADSMGARGCRMIRTHEEALSAVRVAAEHSRSQTVIIEEYMEGPEYSIDALIINGSFFVTGFADRHIYYPPYFIETGHTMPTKESEKRKLELIETFARGAASLGLTCGAAKADIKYTAKGPQVGEIAARLSGGYMSGWTFPYSSDCNLTMQALRIAAGEEPEYLLKNSFALPVKNTGYSVFQLPGSRVSAERAWISIPGTIKAVEGLDNAKNVLHVENVFPRPVKAGDAVDFPRNNVQKCGNVISCADDYDAAVSAAERACSKILVRLEGNNPRTDAFLQGLASATDEQGFPPSAFCSTSELSSLKISGVIPQDASVVQHMPPEVIAYAERGERDWNYLTIMETARRFDLLVPEHPALDARRFWLSLLRGGIQGAIYISDSL